jgi:hypothetical protein
LKLFLAALPAIGSNLLCPAQAQKDFTAHERSELAKQSGLGLLRSRLFRLIKISKVIKKQRQLSSIDAIWLVCDSNRTNFYKLYGRLEEIGLLEVEAVFVWHQHFGLDVLLGIMTPILVF